MATAPELIEAVEAGDAARVAALLAADPSLANARDAAGVSAIMTSRYRSDRAIDRCPARGRPGPRRLRGHQPSGTPTACAEDLASDPARATAFSADGFTALHFAAFFGKAEAARLLLDAGAGVNVVSRNDMQVQPLHSAAAGRHHEVCRVLLAAGADVDATQRHGYTPLHAAAQHGDDRARRAVPVRRGGSRPPALDDGATPADLAERAGHEDVARRIREVASAG